MLPLQIIQKRSRRAASQGYYLIAEYILRNGAAEVPSLPLSITILPVISCGQAAKSHRNVFKSLIRCLHLMLFSEPQGFPTEESAEDYLSSLDAISESLQIISDSITW